MTLDASKVIVIGGRVDDFEKLLEVHALVEVLECFVTIKNAEHIEQAIEQWWLEKGANE